MVKGVILSSHHRVVNGLEYAEKRPSDDCYGWCYCHHCMAIQTKCHACMPLADQYAVLDLIDFLFSI